MTQVWSNFVVDGGGGCTCCGGGGGCLCALLIPPFDGADSSPYADYATAAAIVASSQVSNCIGFVQLISGGLLTSFTADDSVANQVSLSVVGNPDNAPGCQCEAWACMNMLSGSTLTVTISIGNYADATVKLFSCDGTELDSQTGSGPLTFSISADGVYTIKCLGVSSTPGFMGGSDTFDFTLASDDTATTNPVIALWDDSGTTRQLEACPKMYLPPLTESSGTWYASCADAHTVLADALHVSNCVGYAEDLSGLDTPVFTATDGGTSLALGVSAATGMPSSGYLWGSVNAVSGETLSIAWTGFDAAAADIYDDTGTLVESLASSSSPMLSSALPYTGRYIVRVLMGTGPGTTPTSATATITSSGTLSVNPITATYDVGLGCPALLDCGDSCP